MVNCPYCKNPISEGDAFCNTCGSRMPGRQSPPTSFNSAGSYTNDIPDHLVWSIVTAICCQPFGIAAIVFSVLTINDKNNNRLDSARKNSEYARQMINWGLGLGFAWLLIWVGFMFLSVLGNM